MQETLFDNQKYCDLWISFINGDSNSFSELYKFFYKSLYSYGLSFKIEGEQVRDIIQDLFVKLYARPEFVKDASTLRPFLFTSMRNACINSIKTGQRITSLDIIEGFEINYSIDNNSIEDKEELERIKALVKNILDQLTPRQREIIYLRFLHQMEYEEISRIMNLSEQAARNLVYRAMDKMRNDNPDIDPFIVFLLLMFVCR